MNNSIWLAGTGRSGTTWFGNLLAAIGRSALIFEPLHPKRVRLSAELNPPISAPHIRPYLRPHAVAPEWEAYVRDLIEGRRPSPWMRFALRRKPEWPAVLWSFARAERYVVKEIRGNLMEGWLRTRVGVPVVHMIRHPCATVLSQRKAGWGHDLTTFLDSPELVEDHLTEHLDFLEDGLTNDTQRMAARWAIDNLVPLRQAVSRNILVITYEEALLDPARAVRRVAKYAGWSIDDADLRRVASRVGKAVSGLRKVDSPEAMLARWRRSASAKDVHDILSVTQRLGLSTYDEAPIPGSLRALYAVG